MKKKDDVVFGVKRAGVTWLWQFPSSTFKQARAGAKRLGLSLGQLLCGDYPFTGVPKAEGLRRFTHTDQEASTLKIKVTGCDEFTLSCLKRQAKFSGLSVEEYIAEAVYGILTCDEEDSVLDTRTGEVVLQGWELGNYIGCQVDKGAPKPPPDNFTRIPIPAGTIVEDCA